MAAVGPAPISTFALPPSGAVVRKGHGSHFCEGLVPAQGFEPWTLGLKGAGSHSQGLRAAVS